MDTPKIVFSKTSKTVAGKNAVVENGDPAASVNNLKNKEGKGIIVYGGANFVSELIKNNLVMNLIFLLTQLQLAMIKNLYRPV